MGQLDRYLKDKVPEFSDALWHNESGDCLQKVFEDVEFYADIIDDFLTLYRDMQNNKVVGYKIKNVKTYGRDN